MPYAELQVTSNFSFLEGASHPGELVLAAKALGHRAVAITDRNSLAGVVRAHEKAKEVGIQLVIGVRLDLVDGASLLCFPTDLDAYGRLCQLLTQGRRRGEKGKCLISKAEAMAAGTGQSLVLLPSDRPGKRFAAELGDWRRRFPGSVWLAASRRFAQDDARRLGLLARIGGQEGVPLVAVNDVLYHGPDRRPLQDVLTAVRLGSTVTAAGRRLVANAERHLKSPDEMARLFETYPDAIAETLVIAGRSRFSIDVLKEHYTYPIESDDPQAELERVTWEGAAERYPEGVPKAVCGLLVKELDLIARLKFPAYFLTVYEIVHFARSQGILCQGRGSAANSAVCYCLGVTAVDPMQSTLLFERFISEERGEPPDIDIDFEHERREQVIQHIYEKYGRERAALAATVIHYRNRSALKDVGRAMGLSDDAIMALSSSRWGRDQDAFGEAKLRELGFDPGDQTLQMVLDLADQLTGFPRHLSQHVGGFVMTRDRLDKLVPIENARMEDRTIIQWDKDDLDTAGFFKVDVLALGMLTCIRKAFDLIRDHYGQDLELATVPKEDPVVYDMICRADVIGVFQIESRAQMSMLPRLRPRKFYDLVVEVAIVRPGPIQGGMVHPYLRRRQGKESAKSPDPRLDEVLERTMGVPLFQEQAMQIAMVAAKFTPGEADGLRRSMAAFRRDGSVNKYKDRLIDGMVDNGYQRDFAERLFKQIEGFGDYGFPESHAASFAILVYISAWIKCHYPAAFACALLNSQPMGFYAPAQIVRDARDHGVEVHPPDINLSGWDNWLQDGALRLGFRQIAGFSEDSAEALLKARGTGYASPEDLWRRSGLEAKALKQLADADAFGSIGLPRRQALWAVRALGAALPPLFAAAGMGAEQPVVLPKMTMGEQVVEDYAHLRLSLKTHPLALMRRGLAAEKIVPARELEGRGDGRKVSAEGLVLVRQRPGTASGVIFLTLEDETGVCNVVVWPHLFEKARAAVLNGRLLRVTGRLQVEDKVVHLVAESILDRTPALTRLAEGGLKTASRDFH